MLPTNLPAQNTSFVGREPDIAQVKQCLATARLLTLTGAGGCGKTRLALEVAARWVEDDPLEEHPDGVWLVELAALHNRSDVGRKVAEVLGVREQPDRPLIATLVDHLRPKTLLLVVDNCEPLLEACAELVDTLLRRCPSLQILATSKHVLQVAGEKVWPVPSLSFPRTGDRLSGETLAQYEATRLFEERARNARPDFSLTNENGSAVAQICRRLDGIPLAIDLAAAQVRARAPEEIATQLDDRFRVLIKGPRTVLPKYRTLRASVDWSHGLLTRPEKVLLHRLSVFAGNWTFEAATAVCSGQDVRVGRMFNLLSGLVDKSLVVAQEQDGGMRYRLLESIREYGRERLEASAQAGTTRHRHAEYYLALAEEAEPKLRGAEQLAWSDRLAREHDNLRAALHWAADRGEVETGLRLGGALWEFWLLRGYLNEGRERLADVLMMPAASPRTAERAKALSGLGRLAVDQGDYGTARALLEQSLELCRELSDKRGIAYALSELGWMTTWEGDYAAACALYEESLGLSRELGDTLRIAYVLSGLGWSTFCQGDNATARDLYEESLRHMRALGDNWGIATELSNLGNVARVQGNHAAARAPCEESLTLRRELADKRGVATTLSHLGHIVREQGNHETARALCEESLALRRELADMRGIAYSLEAFAALELAQSRAGPAVRLFSAAETLRERIGTPLPPPDRAEYDARLATARADLGEETFAIAWAEGRTLPLERAIALGLDKPLARSRNGSELASQRA